MLKLSEAIRLGAMLRPQCYGTLFEGGKSCAMGAVIEAAGLSGYQEDLILTDLFPAIKTQFPALFEKVQFPNGAMPEWWFDHQVVDVWTAIVVLNNKPNNWTRERIADWVATVEPAEDATTIPPVECLETVPA